MNTKEMLVVFVRTTSAREFFNSILHEVHHMAEFIAKADNIPMVGEEISYMAGELGMMMYPVAKKYMCEHCRCEEK